MFKIAKTALFVLSVLIIHACGSSTSTDDKRPDALRIGANIEITGDYSYAGEHSENALELFLENIDQNGGLQIGGEFYSVQFTLNDNRSQTGDAETVAIDLIENEEVHILIGPNVSGLAIPAAVAANQRETVMISPWSSSPVTTQNRPWVYRASFVDTDQSPILANFAGTHLHATKACVLFDNTPNAFSSGFAASFKTDWESLHGNGSVAAYESYEAGAGDVSLQLTIISNADCDFLLIPSYAHVIPEIVHQVHQAGITVPVLGPDSWVDGDLIDTCGSDCEGYYFLKHFAPSDENSSAMTFVNHYESEFGEQPGDVAALTWDAMLIAELALKNCGEITGDLEADRLCILEGMQNIRNLEGVTGTYTFTESNNPEKCIPVVQIQDGELVYIDTICP